jgi:CBS domain-containing protein
LAGQTIGQILTGASSDGALHPNDPLPQVLDRFDTTSRVVLPIVDDQNHLLGVIHLNEVFWTTHRQSTMPWVLAVDLMRPNVKPLALDDSLERAVELFAENDLSELPVVAAPEKKLLGMVCRTDVARAYLRRVHAQTASSQKP